MCLVVVFHLLFEEVSVFLVDEVDLFIEASLLLVVVSLIQVPHRRLFCVKLLFHSLPDLLLLQEKRRQEKEYLQKMIHENEKQKEKMNAERQRER